MSKSDHRDLSGGKPDHSNQIRPVPNAAQALADERLKALDDDTLEKNRLRAERDEFRGTVATLEQLRDSQLKIIERTQAQYDAVVKLNAQWIEEARLLRVERDEARTEIKRLDKRIADNYTADFIEWKAQEEKRAMTENEKQIAELQKQIAQANGLPTASKFTDRPIVKTLTADATDAAWRLAGSQFVKTTRAPLVGLLTRHLAPDGDDALRARIAAFLETELGGAMLSALLSVGLSSLPTTAGTEVPQRLARELRVRAMAGGAEAVAEVLMAPLREVMTKYLQDVAPMLHTVPATLPEGAGIRSEVVDAERVSNGVVAK